MDATGIIVAGKYRVLEEIGSGGVGSVFKVEQVYMRKIFALKLLNAAVDTTSAKRRFQTEAQTLSMLDHPNLIRVQDFGFAVDDEPYLVTDFIDGIPLDESLKLNGAMSVKDWTELFIQVCFGLHYAHEKRIVHRDMKPGNILLLRGAEPGTEGSIRIIDFGLAKITDGEKQENLALTKTGEVLGTPLYMSPEQCNGLKEVDLRSDIYSLGCVMFEALTGTPPHLASSALRTMILHQRQNTISLREASLGKAFPDSVENLIAMMMKVNVEERYSSLEPVINELIRIKQKGDYEVSSSKAGLSSKKAPTEKGSASKTAGSAPAESNFVRSAIGYVTTAIVFTGFGYWLGQSKLIGPKTQEVSQVAAPPVEAQAKAPPSVQTIPSSNDEEELAKKRAEHLEQETAIIESNDPIIRREVTQNNERTVKIGFPKFPVGTAGPFDLRSPNPPDLEEAIGYLAFPANTPLLFSVDGRNYPNSLRNRALWHKLGKDIFSGLLLKNGTSLLESGSNNSLSLILTEVSSWDKLISLELQSFKLGTDEFKELNKMSKLSRLVISGCEINGPVTQQLVWKRVKQLVLANQQGADEFVAGVSNSNNLDNLAILQSPITTQASESLATCHHLHILCFDKSSTSGSPNTVESIVKSISKLPELQQVFFQDGKLTESQIDLLSSNPSVQKIELGEEPPLSHALQRKYPKLRFKVSTNGQESR